MSYGEIDGPPLSPPDDTIPTRPCPLCGKDMDHDGRWGWRCDIYECGGSIEDEDGPQDDRWLEDPIIYPQHTPGDPRVTP